MVIPLQYAVLVGVGLSVLLHVVRQSNQVTIRRRVRDPDGHLVEVDPPAELPAHEVVVLQPYGSLFFAAAPVFEAALPAVGATSVGSVVILRLRGRSDLGTTFMDVLRRYAEALAAAGSKLVIVSANERIIEQLSVTGITEVIGDENVYPGDERVGATIERASADADRLGRGAALTRRRLPSGGGRAARRARRRGPGGAPAARRSPGRSTPARGRSVGRGDGDVDQLEQPDREGDHDQPARQRRRWRGRGWPWRTSPGWRHGGGTPTARPRPPPAAATSTPGSGALSPSGDQDGRGRQQRGPEEQQRGEQDAGAEEHRAEQLRFAIADPTPHHARRTTGRRSSRRRGPAARPARRCRWRESA